ncbi:alanine--tRNA ligase-related protein [Patescibacteria group bacterium]|nr:alanine--tRNA ligase-related protein [Patescibacteria group bacterium]
MTADQLRKKYIEFFVKKGHKLIPSAPLVPENDPTTLFISAGMQPLIPYLIGQPHPEGKRLVDYQKCLRTDDIEEVGDHVHHTFFEMLGNWSLGDYFKQEAIKWSYEFLTTEQGLDLSKDQLAVSVFAGDENAPFDQESYQIWLDLGLPATRIAKLPKANNWWGPAGQSGPCGPDSEMFIWTGDMPVPEQFDPEDSNWVEIWNDVFMEYNKNPDGEYEKLQQKNVDTGMGLERVLAIINGFADDYQTDLFWPIIQALEESSGKKYVDHLKDFRIIADHLRAACFLLATDIPLASKDDRGAVLRKLIDRMFEVGKALNINKQELARLSGIIPNIYKKTYPDLYTNRGKIQDSLISSFQRIEQIGNTQHSEINNLPKVIQGGSDLIMSSWQELLSKYSYGAATPRDFLKNHNFNSLGSVYAGTVAFDSRTTYGYPISQVEQITKQVMKSDFDQSEFQKTIEALNKEHKEKSHIGGEKRFKGGLSEISNITTKYHTATHLLHAALRKILGSSVAQKGSNITSERLRFDFSYPEKLTAEQLKEVENLVKQTIQESLPVSSEIMDKDLALKSGALGFFTEKYGEKVSVYSIGNFSKEICGGPHVTNTAQLGNFQITKEESAGSGIRRIYAVLS